MAKRFEYSTVTLVGSMLTAVLNSWGETGWEVIAVLSPKDGLSAEPIAIMKREIEDDLGVDI